MDLIRADRRRSPGTGTITYTMAGGPPTLTLHCEFVFARQWNYERIVKRYQHIAPEWTRVYVLSRGRIEVAAAGKACTLTAPGIWLLPTAQTCTLSYHDIAMHYFHLALHDDTGLSVTGVVEGFPGISDAALVRGIGRAFTSGDMMYCETAVFHAAVRLLRPYAGAIAAKHDSFGPYRRLTDIARNHAGNIPVGRIAELLATPRETLSRGFRRRTGISIKSYLDRVRTEEAKKLVVYSDLPTAEIAERLGFTDRFHFFRFFKKQAGLSPTQYRQRHRVIGPQAPGPPC